MANDIPNEAAIERGAPGPDDDVTEPLTLTGHTVLVGYGQVGRIVAGEAPPEGRLDLPEEELPADSLFLREDYPRIVAYRRDCAALRQAIARRERVDEALPERILGENPRFFGAWALCADYREEVLGDREGARRCREEALRLEIPRLSERQEIERKLK